MLLTDTMHLRDIFNKTIFKYDKEQSGSGEPNLFNFYFVRFLVDTSDPRDRLKKNIEIGSCDKVIPH